MDRALQDALKELYGRLSDQPLPPDMADLVDRLEEEMGDTRAGKSRRG